ncbi:MAG: phenylalanine--tRNA ligase subunit beta [Verrucomicrobia bacterium]|nr:phenylalanine--tRNA ligase subunit beta [Verrucomicrobiota bacterium]MBS0635904.1 phenylalanine--tRNA ligase subunit beta [Verrucomicrobiota bacterium]
MKILLSWLREYLPLEDLSGLVDICTRAGIEVDYIEEIKTSFTGVVAARIKKVCKHSSSPNLSCATIFDGKNDHTVVCSAANCREGMITAYAPVGATVNHKRIDTVQFGDTPSQGVLLSEHELGLSEFHEGIIDLPDSVKEGTQLDRYFEDTVYEMSVTPNLGHCQSVMGIARELAAFMGVELKKRPWQESSALKALSSSKLSVTVQDSMLCPRYSALLIEGVTVSPSPTLIRLRLERTGHRSINNIVDITNYISQDIGQPLHAFDADRVHGGHLIIRAAKPEEPVTLLDDVTHKLPEGAIVISDAQQILALGGIMGGEHSGVTLHTKRIILESAYFNASAIRKARTRLGLCTDASKRFERGTDSSMTAKALEYAWQMIHRKDSQAHLECFIDVATERLAKSVSCRLSRAGRLLGYEVSANEAESAFSRLGLHFSFDGQDTYTISVPSYRHDITEEVDLIEEIGRIVGLQRDVTVPAHYAASPLAHHPMYIFDGQVRRRLLTLGLQEAITSDLISPEMAKIAGAAPETVVEMMNPLSSEQSILRPSLLPGLLDVVQRNLNLRILDLQFFEVGHAHLKKGTGFVEPRLFSIMLTGKARSHHFSRKDREWDFFDLKGMLEELFSTLRFSEMTVEKSKMSMFHPERQAKVFVDGVHIGIMGELHPELLQRLGIDQRVLYSECDMQELINLSQKACKMEELALFPASQRDWTITLPKKVSYAEITNKINEIKPAICEAVTLVSLFEHEKLGADRHNVTLNFVYRDREKTVSQDEVEAAHQKLVSTVSKYLAEKYTV